MTPALHVENLRVTSREGRVLLDVPLLTLDAGQSLALRGASGAGKSTLLHVLSGLVRPSAGRVVWGGQDIAALTEDARARFRRETLGLIFQDCHLFEELSALGNAGLASAFAPARDRAPIRLAAAQWLAALGLGQAGARAVDSFSGGERQRIAVARALAGGPPVILADEPTAALDRANADALGADLVRLAAEGGRMLITVTHDAALAARMGRQITIADGRIVEDSDA
ncbi:ATP-binding cassette domain-containing protein [Frigidibacter albus]|uniref:ATP-binding cassette domain-containing protein n=1 Tax=Frigidibacter albus TaxID=1465486 RepID=A0A6L8VKE8_9RHOB|nr:ABC transporter ATP-binding protein [Frigidibacter albus]MZQ90845.1 ATP-binding cassette domain-containing protein [Frigidibacter albus]NBE32537.1 ATP-binding cassette domain-containing protein [Frigidibacter albus]GGH61452.1 antimicrobial peptide ABC transporter ATPase [Frigidibacter albus]